MTNTNKKLTAANEAEVLKLVQDCKIKGQWQAFKYLNGAKQADYAISKLHNIPRSTVEAARFYW